MAIQNNNQINQINNSEKLTPEQRQRIQKFQDRCKNEPTFDWTNKIFAHHAFAYRDDIVLSFSEMFFKMPIIQQLNFPQQSQLYGVMTGLLARTYNQNYLENLSSVISNPLNPKYKTLKKFFEKNKVYLEDSADSWHGKKFPNDHFSFTKKTLETSFMFSVIKTTITFLTQLDVNEDNFDSILEQYSNFTEKLKIGILTCSKIINVDMLPDDEMKTIFESPEKRNLYVYHFNKEIAFRNSIDNEHDNFGAYVWKLNGDEKYWKQILPFCFESNVALSSFTNSFTFNSENKPLTYWLDSQVLAGMSDAKQWSRTPQLVKKIIQENEPLKSRMILEHHDGLSTQECIALRQVVASFKPTRLASDRRVSPVENIDINLNSPTIIQLKEEEDYSELIDFDSLTTTKKVKL